MSYQRAQEAKKVTVRQASKLAQELDICSRCPDCQNMILERDIKHPCLYWPFRSLE